MRKEICDYEFVSDGIRQWTCKEVIVDLNDVSPPITDYGLAVSAPVSPVRYGLWIAAAIGFSLLVMG